MGIQHEQLQLSLHTSHVYVEYAVYTDGRLKYHCTVNLLLESTEYMCL